MKLSNNERHVLKLLLKNGRVTDTEISKKLGITAQGVGKIRKKLEDKGIIKGYSVRLDYSGLGINVFAIGLFKFVSGRWGRSEDRDIKERIKGEHIIATYRVPEGDVTHIVVYGFRTLEELDDYFQNLQNQRKEVSELKKLYIFSEKSLIKDSAEQLLLKVIDGME
ncbi:MAG: hypothetical protein A7315_09375 [Candidatus Altiarchaeales archaeon WOR_SM1_79]|nr:MAG: hypothetical protein A7315_09375 [Candidatus Altiarchaeales archaeon WOR_SM1_79]